MFATLKLVNGPTFKFMGHKHQDLLINKLTKQDCLYLSSAFSEMADEATRILKPEILVCSAHAAKYFERHFLNMSEFLAEKAKFLK